MFRTFNKIFKVKTLKQENLSFVRLYSKWDDYEGKDRNFKEKYGNFKDNNREDKFGENRNNKYTRNDRTNDRTNDRPKFLKEEYIPVDKDIKDLFQEHKQVSNVEMYSDLPITLEGDNIPEPITGPEDSMIHPQIRNNLKNSKITKFTPIQKHGISFGFKNRDMMACSQTGSGKTIAFLIPIITHIAKGVRGERIKISTFESNLAPVALVLAPTRELANQIYDEARKISHMCNVKIVTVYGGASINNQIEKLNNGCDLLVATPGRLIDLLDRGIVNLEKIDYLIFDEADRMLDMGFRDAMEKIMFSYTMRPVIKRNTFMFSATFPKEIQQMAKDFLQKNYIFVSVGRVGSTTDLIEQKFIAVSDLEKMNALKSLVKPNTKYLIFCNTKNGCMELEYSLKRENFSVISLHGDKSQSQRDLALKGYKSGSYHILIATDIAARGLDINDISHVVNFDLPKTIDDYVHRIGRTGRAGKKGISISLVTKQDCGLKDDLTKLLLESKQEIPKEISDLPDRRSMGGLGNNRNFGNRMQNNRFPNTNRFSNNNDRFSNNNNRFSNNNERFSNNNDRHSNNRYPNNRFSYQDKPKNDDDDDFWKIIEK